MIRVTDQPSFDVSRMKEIRGVETGSNSIESRLIALAAWMREQYGATMIQALKTVLPVKQKMKQKEERWIRLLLEKDEAENQLELCRKKHYVARQRLLEALLENDTISYFTFQYVSINTRSSEPPINSSILYHILSTMIFFYLFIYFDITRFTGSTILLMFFMFVDLS